MGSRPRRHEGHETTYCLPCSPWPPARGEQAREFNARGDLLRGRRDRSDLDRRGAEARGPARPHPGAGPRRRAQPGRPASAAWAVPGAAGVAGRHSRDSSTPARSRRSGRRRAGRWATGSWDWSAAARRRRWSRCTPTRRWPSPMTSPSPKRPRSPRPSSPRTTRWSPAGGSRPGERVLIHAVGSGVGTAAAQIASHLGATVLGTSRSADKLARALVYGLDVGIDTSRNSFAEAIGDRCT